MNQKFIELDISRIKTSDKLRKNIGDTTTLENSIRKLGLLSPLIVDPDNVLISGYRRLSACNKIGLSHVPVIRVDVPARSMTALDIQTDENLCRQPLSPEELQQHIQEKKLCLEEETTSKGFVDKIKKAFGRQ